MTDLLGTIVFFSLLITFFIFVWVFLLIISSCKISSWLKKNRPEKLEELTSIGSLGPGFMNSIRFFKYVDSNEDDDKIEISKLKCSFRKKANTLKYLIVVLILSFVFLCLVDFVLE